jgi:NADH-quinone oxidoreductase subunit D
VRRDLPYGAYPELKFDVPVGRGYVGTEGDAFDRYYVRVLEMGQSSRLVRQALEKIPDGEITAKVPRKIKPEPGEAFSRVESARGAMTYHVISDGTEKPWRVRIRTGSFMAMGIIEDVSPGLMVADLVALIASLDVVAPEIDR